MVDNKTGGVMRILILLGQDQEFLGYRIFKTFRELETWIEDNQALMLANIEGELPLKERLKLVKGGYFPFAGKLQDVVPIDFRQGGSESELNGDNIKERPIAKNLHLIKDPAKKLDTFVLRDKFNREPNDIFAEARASASRRCEVAGWQLHDVTVDINAPDLDGERTNYYCEIWGWEE